MVILTRIVVDCAQCLAEGLGDEIVGSEFRLPNAEELGAIYEKRELLYRQLIKEIRYSLEKSLKRQKISTTHIESRLKDFEHFYEKIMRKRYVGDMFERVEDIAGVRVICPYRSDLERVEQVIRAEFKVVKAEVMRNRSKQVFGYMSDQYIVKLPSRFSGERYDSIKDLQCEIQVRTVSMHAWATVSHHLEYKQEIDIPSELKNDFYALSGVFYIADSLFEKFKDARERSARQLSREVNLKGFDFDAEVNRGTLEAYLLWKFPHRKRGKTLSGLLDDIRFFADSSYRILERYIEANIKWCLSREERKMREQSKKNPERKKLRAPYSAAHVAELCLYHEMHIL